MPIKKLMHLLANLFPNTDSGDNPVAVKLFHRMTVVKDFFAAKKFSKNNLGEYLYVKVGALIAQQATVVLPVTNMKNKTLTPQAAVVQISSMPVSNVPNNISNVSLSKNVALQTFYPAPEPGEYDNLPPEPAAVVNALELNKWYKIIVVANLKEFKNNVWVNALKSNGSPVTQTVTKTFRTGPMELVSASNVINKNNKSN